MSEPKSACCALRLIFWSGGAALLLAGLAVFGVLVVWPLLYPPTTKPKPPEVEDAKTLEKVPVPRVLFKDITRAAFGEKNLFIHNNGSTGQKLLPETMGSGVAFIDYNNDGLQDILLVNSCDWPGEKPNTQCTRTLKLYENLGNGKFKDVTAVAGLDIVMYGMGVTVGDFDNDGHPDLFITGVGGNKLFRNIAERDASGKETHRFKEVTSSAGLLVDPAQRWPEDAGREFLKRRAPICFSSSATFVDVDGDGWLDLFVCNYVTWSPGQDLARANEGTGSGKRSFGPPKSFEGAHCFVYRNLGKDKSGRWLGFQDVSQEAGVQILTTTKLKLRVGKSLGVAAWDIDGDGFPEVFVANDGAANFLFQNLGLDQKGHWRGFKEIGAEANFDLVDANARGGMGIDVAEYRPGCLAVVIGNFNDEPNTFFCLENPRQLFFTDVANNEGIAAASRELLKFGVLFFDYDLDGRLDLITCNGQLEPEIKVLDSHQDYKQPVQLFWNTGRDEARFELVTDREAGPDLFVPMVGRGCAYADIDLDGYPDLVLTENGGQARLLHNDGGTGNHCLRLVLKGDGIKSNTSAIGARVRLTAGKTVLVRDVAGARGYLSQSELPITFGLGKTTRIDRLEIRWPGVKGGTQVLENLEADKIYTVTQGQAKPEVRALRKK
jgi:hypothetical protein